MMSKIKFDLQEAIHILGKTPTILEVLLIDLTTPWLMSNEGENTWSPYDIVGHLIHGEKTDWMTRAKIILGNQENKTFETFDRFAQFENSKGKSINTLLQEFRTLRQDNLKDLSELNLSQKDLERRGIHPQLGPVNLGYLLATWVAHDLSHINQMTRVMARNLKDEVGPWQEFMTILQ